MNRLKTTYEWDKVVDINLARTNMDNFLQTLHAVDSEEVKQELARTGQNARSQMPSATEDGQTASGLPELQNLMGDSVISLAKLSEV